MIKHILLDIDGVLADFVSGALKVHNRGDFKVTHWDFFKSMGMSANEFWKKIDEAGSDFWSKLDPFPWMSDLLSVVSQMSVYTLLTSPSLHHSSYAGKRLWIQEYFGSSFTHCMVGSQKHLLSRDGVVLIDDSDENCRKFEEEGEGIAILFPQPWNELRHMESHKEKIEYVNSRLLDLY